MINPTVGRKVWYRTNDFDKLGFGAIVCAHGQPCDATVVAVHNDRLVNLVIFDANGNMHKRTSVKLLQDDDVPRDGEAYAEWMPYQTKQAEKEAAS